MSSVRPVRQSSGSSGRLVSHTSTSPLYSPPVRVSRVWASAQPQPATPPCHVVRTKASAEDFRGGGGDPSSWGSNSPPCCTLGTIPHRKLRPVPSTPPLQQAHLLSALSSTPFYPALSHPAASTARLGPFQMTPSSKLRPLTGPHGQIIPQLQTSQRARATSLTPTKWPALASS